MVGGEEVVRIGLTEKGMFQQGLKEVIERANRVNI